MLAEFWVLVSWDVPTTTQEARVRGAGDAPGAAPRARRGTGAGRGWGGGGLGEVERGGQGGAGRKAGRAAGE